MTPPSPEQAATTTGSSGSASGRAPGDHALDMLLDLETRVAGLKKLHEHLAQREQQLSAREAEIVAREQGLGARESNIDEREVAHAESVADAEKARAQVDSDRLEVEVGTAALKVEREEVAEKRRRVQDALEAHERERRTTADATAALAEKELQFAQRERETKESERRSLERESHFKEIERALDERDAKVAEREHETEAKERWQSEREKSLSEREKHVETAGSEQERLNADLDARQASARERERALESQVADLERRERGAADAERLVTELAEREKELAAMSDQMKAREAELKEQSDQLGRDRAAVTEQQPTLAQQASDAESQGAAIWSGRMEQLQMELGEARAAKASLLTELAQAKEAAEATRQMAQGEAAGSAARVEEQDALKSRVAALEAELEESRSNFKRSQNECERIREEVQAAHERAKRAGPRRRKGDISEDDRRVAELEERLAKMAVERDELRVQVEQERARVAASPPPSAAGKTSTADADEFEKQDQAIALLRDRLERIQGENASMTRRLAEAEAKAARVAEQAAEAEQAPEPTEADEEVVNSVQRRHRRLRAYKSLLQGQARKIVAAQTALQRRHSDCEMILSQRTRLAQAAAEVGRREKKAASAKARSGAAATMLYIVAALGIVLVLSWEGTKRVWPGTFVARATVEADTRGRKASPEALTQWQQDHEAMLKDPRLMEFAAERFTRRGIVGFGKAVDVQERLGRDLYVQTSQPGVMTIELRGQGAERSAMELDTFVTAFKSLADMSRDERASTLGLAVTQAATAGQEPLMDQRLQYAGMVFGCGAAGTIVIGMGLWFRLSRVKKKFDHAQAVEAALDQVDWATLEKTFKKPGRVEGDENQRIAA